MICINTRFKIKNLSSTSILTPTNNYSTPSDAFSVCEVLKNTLQISDLVEFPQYSGQNVFSKSGPGVWTQQNQLPFVARQVDSRSVQSSHQQGKL